MTNQENEDIVIQLERSRAKKNKENIAVSDVKIVDYRKTYGLLVLVGIVIYAVLVFVLNMFLDFPGCAAVIAMNVLVFALVKLNKLEKRALGNSYNSTIKCRETYRVVTSAFTHYDPIHMLCNLASLYNIGPYMEELLGTPLFITLYALIMVAGGYISGLLHKKKPGIPSIGASGVICGFLGIYLAIAFIVAGFAGITSMLPTIALLVLMTFSPKIDSIGHFTGLFLGILCGIVYSFIYFI